jgi:hypothetical protein
MAEAQLAVGVQEGGEIIVIPPARREDLLAQWGIALMVTVLLCLSLSLKSHVLDNAPLSIAYPALMLSYVLFGFLREMFSTEEVRVDHYTIEIERRLFGISIGAEVFKTQEVSNVRIGRAGSWSFKRRQEEGGILFDEGKNTFSFGAGLDGEHAQEFVSVINRRLREHGRG